ncbi:hypothetical protein [Thermus brockianus]|uniref:Uncharacterized protein n=1 Tax=Thermus caliditerrae TaxID=1330700 RepID=A0A7C5RE70_9DEIN
MRYEVSVSIGFPSPFERAIALATHRPEALFPNQLAAIRDLAVAAHRKWVGYALGEPLPSGERVQPRTGNYARSITLEAEADHSYTLKAKAPYAAALEWGRPAYDLREVLKRSHQARRAKAGHLYMHIPFRHGTPGAVGFASVMPEEVYARARRMAQSRVVGVHHEPSVHDPSAFARRFRYQWGDRLTLGDLEALGLDTSDPQVQRLAGLYRFEAASTPNESRSAYLTFRTLSEKSPPGSWVIPEHPGYRVAGAVYDWLRQVYPEVMRLALEADVNRLKALAGGGA